MGRFSKMTKNTTQLESDWRIAFFMSDRGHKNVRTISLLAFARVFPNQPNGEQDCACDAPDIHDFSAAHNRSTIPDTEQGQLQAATGLIENDCC